MSDVFWAEMLAQTATYWPPATPDIHGRPTWGAGVEISARWEDRAEEFLDAQGEEAISRARVFVDQDVEVGGVLLLSALADVGSPSDPKANAGAWEIRATQKIPTLEADEWVRTATL